MCRAAGQSVENVIRVLFQSRYGSEANFFDLPLSVLLQLLASYCDEAKTCRWSVVRDRALHVRHDWEARGMT
jgi:hypothetical protein